VFYLFLYETILHNISTFKNFNINLMLYLFDTGLYYTVCLHFTLTTTTLTYAFHLNVIYICLYLHVFLLLYLKVLTSILCYIYFVRGNII